MKTENQLRERAQTIVAGHDQRAAIRGKVKDFDAARDARLAVMDAEITNIESRADGEDVGLVQQLVIRREQRARLAAKLTKEREALLVDVDREAAQAVADVDLVKFFADALAAEWAKAVTAFLPFFENEVRATGAAAVCDAVVALGNLATLCLHPDIKTESLLPRVKRFSEGGRLWGTI